METIPGRNDQDQTTPRGGLAVSAAGLAATVAVAATSLTTSGIVATLASSAAGLLSFKLAKELAAKGIDKSMLLSTFSQRFLAPLVLALAAIVSLLVRLGRAALAVTPAAPYDKAPAPNAGASPPATMNVVESSVLAQDCASAHAVRDPASSGSLLVSSPSDEFALGQRLAMAQMLRRSASAANMSDVAASNSSSTEATATVTAFTGTSVDPGYPSELFQPAPAPSGSSPLPTPSDEFEIGQQLAMAQMLQRSASAVPASTAANPPDAPQPPSAPQPPVSSHPLATARRAESVLRRRPGKEQRDITSAREEYRTGQKLAMEQMLRRSASAAAAARRLESEKMALLKSRQDDAFRKTRRKQEQTYLPKSEQTCSRSAPNLSDASLPAYSTAQPPTSLANSVSSSASMSAPSTASTTRVPASPARGGSLDSVASTSPQPNPSQSSTAQWMPRAAAMKAAAQAARDSPTSVPGAAANGVKPEPASDNHTPRAAPKSASQWLPRYAMIPTKLQTKGSEPPTAAFQGSKKIR